MKVIDIGCGPGTIVKHLPRISYHGFDIDESYIAYARRNYSEKGDFHCRFFDGAAAEEFGPADVVMMNGVVHHLTDSETATTFRSIRKALKPGGMLFTLDGCYVDGQSAVRAWMLRNDRGRHVRRLEQYRSLMSREFDPVEFHIREDISWFPYTWAIGIGRVA